MSGKILGKRKLCFSHHEASKDIINQHEGCNMNINECSDKTKGKKINSNNMSIKKKG